MKQQLSNAGIPATATTRTPDAMPSEKTFFQNPPAPEFIPFQDENSPEFHKEEKLFREFILSRLPKHKASQNLIQKLKLTIKNKR